MASVTWTGLEELQEALRSMPDRLVGEAFAIVDDAAERALASIYQAYPRGDTGNLRAGLKKIEESDSRWGVTIVVKNTAKHAWLYDHGSQARHVSLLPKWPASNFGPNRGAMPPAWTFIKTAIRERSLMVRQLVEMVRREGFTVTGAP